MPDKHPTSQVLVRFQDCDPFGHLNNTRYIDYFLNARTDHLRAYYAFDLEEHAKTHRANWVVTHHEIAYLRPAFPGEAVTIQTELIAVTESTVTVDNLMFDEDAQQLKAALRTTYRYVDLSSGRPAEHPSEVIELLHDILIDEDTLPDTLEERIRQVKAAQKSAAGAV